MEKEGLKRALDHLERNNLKLDNIVTDHHTKVQRFVRERGITQYYYVWQKWCICLNIFHNSVFLTLSKSCKQLQNIRIVQCFRGGCLQLKTKSIKNHIYWTMMTSKSGPEKAAKCKSIINHIQDVHSHDDPLFPKCFHLEISTDPNKWFYLCMNQIIWTSFFLVEK